MTSETPIEKTTEVTEVTGTMETTNEVNNSEVEKPPTSRKRAAPVPGRLPRKRYFRQR